MSVYISEWPEVIRKDEVFGTHKVMIKLAENGGKVPDDLKH